jgi:hypothetical protein
MKELVDISAGLTKSGWNNTLNHGIYNTTIYEVFCDDGLDWPTFDFNRLRAE